SGTGEHRDPARTATVENGDLFAEGDIVMAADRQAVAVVRAVTGNDVHLEHPGTFSVKQDETLIAANWNCGLIPHLVSNFGGQQLALARSPAPLRQFDVVAVWDQVNGQFEPRPERVARVAASVPGFFVSASPVPDLAVNAFVICGEFPARVTVSSIGT